VPEKPPRPKLSREQARAVSAKIAYLVREGVPKKQAVAEAYSMQRAGRLTSTGEYKRVKPPKK
jgi:hypothetical protein